MNNILLWVIIACVYIFTFYGFYYLSKQAWKTFDKLKTYQTKLDWSNDLEELKQILVELKQMYEKEGWHKNIRYSIEIVYRTCEMKIKTLSLPKNNS